MGVIIKMKKSNLLGLMVIISLLLIGNVSALELNPFADKKIYEPTLKEDLSDFIKEDFNEKYGVIRLSKTFFWIESDRIAEYSLTKNTEKCIINCEAEGKVTLYQDGRLFDDVKFMNIGQTKEVGIKDSKYLIFDRYKDNYVNVPDTYKEVCETVEANTTLEEDTTSCYDVVDTYKKVNSPIEIWKDYDGNELKAGDYRWKIKGVKEQQQSVDFIPIINGKGFDEWAEWVSSFNEDILSYWKMDDSSGELKDELEINNISGADNYGFNAKINTGIAYTSTRGSSDDVYQGSSWTLGGWYNISSPNSKQSLILLRESGGTETGIMTNDGSNWKLMTDNNILSDTHPINTSGDLAHIMAVFNSDTGEALLYVNGELKTNNSISGSIDYTDASIQIIGIAGISGDPTYMGMDEWGLWNRTLSSSEISDLHNNGEGITYRTDFNTPPTVTLNAPTNDTKYTTSPQTINFNCSAENDIEVANVTLYINGIANYTQTGDSSNFTELYQSLDFTEGNYNWTCSAYDDESAEGTTETRIFGVDSTSPTLESHNISNVITTEGFPSNLTWWFNATDSHLDSCWYYSSDNSTNISTTCNGEIINAPWNSEGTKTLYYCANDTFGNEQCNSTSLFVYGITLTQLESQDPVGEGDSVTYTLWINLTDLDSDWAETNATLRLNNTDYSPSKYTYSDAMKFIYTKQFTNESGAVAGATHYWNWTYDIQNSTYDLSNGTTETSNTTVYKVAIDDCSAYGTRILNYTLYDEEYKSNSNPTALANQSIEIDVTLTKGSYNWEYSKKETSTNTADICVPNSLLNNSNYFMDVIARYKADYHVVEFNYIVDYNLTNNSLPQHIHLYDLYSQTDRSEYSTSFLVNYQDENYLPVQDAIIDLWRYYVGDGEFLSVEHGKTDADGNTRLHFVTEDVRYNAFVRVDGELVYTSPEFLALCQASPCQINLQKESGVTAVGNYSQVENLAYTVSLDKPTKTVTLSYSTVDGSSANLNLNVTKFNAYGNDTVCIDSASSSGGTLSCTVPESATNTTYLVEIWKDGESLPTYVFDLKPDAYETFGYTGVIMTGMLYLTLVLMAVSSGGIAVLVFGFLGLIVATMLTLFSGGTIIGVGSSLMWLLVAIIIVAIKIANRRGE